MTHHGVQLLWLLCSLGLKTAFAILPENGEIQDRCEAEMDKCETQYNAQAGTNQLKECNFFNLYTQCYQAHMHMCHRFNHDLQTYEGRWTKALLKLDPGCTISTTPLDFAASSSGRSFSSASSYPSSSAIEIPRSGNSGGRPFGFLSIFMNLWQWALLCSCCFCCCALSCCLVAYSRRRHGYYDPYYDHPYGRGGCCDMDGPGPYTLPRSYGPTLQAAPVSQATGTQSYTTAAPIAQSYSYPGTATNMNMAPRTYQTTSATVQPAVQKIY